MLRLVASLHSPTVRPMPTTVTEVDVECQHAQHDVDAIHDSAHCNAGVIFVFEETGSQEYVFPTVFNDYHLFVLLRGDSTTTDVERTLRESTTTFRKCAKHEEAERTSRTRARAACEANRRRDATTLCCVATPLANAAACRRLCCVATLLANAVATPCVVSLASANVAVNAAANASSPSSASPLLQQSLLSLSLRWRHQVTTKSSSLADRRSSRESTQTT